MNCAMKNELPEYRVHSTCRLPWSNLSVLEGGFRALSVNRSIRPGGSGHGPSGAFQASDADDSLLLIFAALQDDDLQPFPNDDLQLSLFDLAAQLADAVV